MTVKWSEGHYHVNNAAIKSFFRRDKTAGSTLKRLEYAQRSRHSLKGALKITES